MPTRNVVLTGHHEQVIADLDEGRYREIAKDGLEAAIGELGRQASGMMPHATA